MNDIQEIVVALFPFPACLSYPVYIWLGRRWAKWEDAKVAERMKELNDSNGH